MYDTIQQINDKLGYKEAIPKSKRMLFELVIEDDFVIDEIRAISKCEAEAYFKDIWGCEYPKDAIIYCIDDMSHECQCK